MKKATKATKTIKMSKTEAINLTIHVLGRKFHGTGATFAEAFDTAKEGLKHAIIRNKCILVVEKGDMKKERILMPVFANRLLHSHGLMRDVMIKNTSLLFGV